MRTSTVHQRHATLPLTSVPNAMCRGSSAVWLTVVSRTVAPADIQGNEVYGGAATSAGIFLHRSSDDAVVVGEHMPCIRNFKLNLSRYRDLHSVRRRRREYGETHAGDVIPVISLIVCMRDNYRNLQ